MQTQLIHGVLYAKAFDVRTRSVEAVLSSETIDGHGDIIDQASWRLARYQQNPVVLHMHSRYDVIGHAQNVRVDGGQLQGRIVFATTKLAEEVATLFRDGAMRAFSVGFRPGRILEETTAAGRKVERLLDCELLEVSAVSIPSNPDAIVKYKSLGLLPAGYVASAGDALIREVESRAWREADEMSDDFIRSARVKGERSEGTTTDAALDFLGAVEARAARDDSDPFDFGGAA